MTRKGIPIEDYHVKYKIDTGISMAGMSFGLISDYEELETMRFTNHNIPEWRSLSSQEQAKLIAFHRIESIIELNKSDAQQIEADRKAKKNK